jgi:hypothetical protein
MPIFSRHDGDLILGAAPMRRIMPYLMRTRNESVVFHECTYRAAAIRAWLAAYNRCHATHATIFDVLLYACGQALHVRPQLNRFVSGGRLYQRRGVQVSFLVKREMSDDGGATTVKIDMLQAEPFAAFVERVIRIIADSRKRDQAVDRETALVARLPGTVLRVLVALARQLDSWNLYPRFMTANDPMYASVFLANLGSVGISDAYHHLYEYGTCSIFGVMSSLRPTPFVDGDRVVVNEGLQVRWTFDARVADGFYAARSLGVVQQVLEDPHRYLGAPEADVPFALEAVCAGAGGRPRP